MTRLFPRPYEGLHDFFPPSQPNGRFRTTWPVVGVPIGGCLGSLAFTLGYLTNKSARRAATFSIKTAAYACKVLTPLLAFAERIQTINARLFLEAKGISVPASQLYVRTGTFDLDDSFMVGAASGLLVAGAFRRRLALGAWRRSVGLASIGAFAGGSGLFLWRSKVDPAGVREAWELSTARQEQEMQHRSEVKRVVSEEVARRRGVALPAARNRQELVQTASTSMTPIALGKANPDYENIGPVTLSEREGPHITAKYPDEPESHPTAARNYLWNPTSDRVTPELEKHMEALQAERAQLTREAELLWHWLAEKEGDLDRLSAQGVGLDAEQEKHKLKTYCQVLGACHMGTWQAVSAVDWCLRDSRKRLAQHRSKGPGGNDDHFQPWMPPAPSLTEDLTPTVAIRDLKKSLQKVERSLALVDQAKVEKIRQLEQGIDTEIDADSKAMLLAQANWRDLASQMIEEKKQIMRREKEAMEVVLRDAQGRAQSLRRESAVAEKER